MRRHGHSSRAFTLLELILVMGIIALVAVAVAPRLATFSVSRSTQDTAGQIVALARYAHAQAIAEGRTYHLCFDPAAGTYWLTADDGTGNFRAPGSDMGRKFQAAAGVRLAVDVAPLANIQLNVPATQPQQTMPQPPPVSGVEVGPPGQLVYNVRTDAGAYIEFQPSGRTDTVHIHLTDRLGDTVEIACASPTESLAIVTGGEDVR